MFFRTGKKTAQDVSINEPIDSDKDGNALTLMDTMAVDDTVIDDIDVRMKSEKLYDYLPIRRPLPQREVAARLGISRSYVSRIEKRALSKLRACFEAGEGGK